MDHVLIGKQKSNPSFVYNPHFSTLPIYKIWANQAKDALSTPMEISQVLLRQPKRGGVCILPEKISPRIISNQHFYFFDFSFPRSIWSWHLALWPCTSCFYQGFRVCVLYHPTLIKDRILQLLIVPPLLKNGPDFDFGLCDLRGREKSDLFKVARTPNISLRQMYLFNPPNLLPIFLFSCLFNSPSQPARMSDFFS